MGSDANDLGYTPDPSKTNLTGERPFHTRTRKSPGNGRRGFPTTQTGEDTNKNAPAARYERRGISFALAA